MGAEAPDQGEQRQIGQCADAVEAALFPEAAHLERAGAGTPLERVLGNGQAVGDFERDVHLVQCKPARIADDH